jgi:hypothetical protein
MVSRQQMRLLLFGFFLSTLWVSLVACHESHRSIRPQVLAVSFVSPSIGPFLRFECPPSNQLRMSTKESERNEKNDGAKAENAIKVCRVCKKEFSEAANHPRACRLVRDRLLGLFSYADYLLLSG